MSLVNNLSKLFLFLACSISAINIYCQRNPVPFWVKNGTKLEYAGEVLRITFYNASMISEPLLQIFGTVMSKDSNITTLTCEEKKDIRLSILVKDINNSIASLKVNLTIGSFSSAKDLKVDLLTRQVTLLDGTPLGQTTIWIQPCRVGDKIPLIWQGNSTIFGKASEAFSIDTIQGVQDAFILDVSEHQEKGYVGIFFNTTLTPLEAQTIKHFSPRINLYDSDTFIMISGRFNEDAILSAFNIVSLSTSFKLVYTNIDLGPSNLLVALLRSIPYIILVTTILVVTVYFIFVRKKKSKKH